MSKTEVSYLEVTIWKTILDLITQQKDYESLAKKTEAQVKDTKSFYKAQFGKEFNPDDQLVETNSITTQPKPTSETETTPKKTSQSDNYNKDGKMKDKIYYALDQNGGKLNKNEIVQFLQKKEPGLRTVSIEQNFYSMIQRELLTRPDGYGGKVSIKKRK